MIVIKNYINGAFVDAVSGKHLENINPAKGEIFSTLPDSDAADIELAVTAAKAAFEKWSTCGIDTRAKYLEQIALGIEQKLAHFAHAESLDSGKPQSVAMTVDIPRAASNFRFFGTAIRHFSAESHYTEPEAINFTLRQPIGVAGCISPWNLPLYLFTWKIAPALAAGNTVVAKPSELTPYTAFLLSELCAEIGLPAGVLNIVHGLGGKVGQAITEHPEIPIISFTGGTATGKILAQTAAPMFKKLSLELGGKNPNILFADCDFEQAVATSVRSSFSNQGQICLCGSRILVEASIYDKFKAAFLKEVDKLTVGNPVVATTQIGALVSEAHMEKVLGYIHLAEEEGGTILAGGKRVLLDGENAKGFFVAPTVIEGLENTCRTNQEEIFGPVVTLQRFTNAEDALQKANGTIYGLAATVWTDNIRTANYMSTRLKFGIVWVNCWMLRDLRTPFGGNKQSGIGREGGWEALRFFTEAKNVCLKI